MAFPESESPVASLGLMPQNNDRACPTPPEAPAEAERKTNAVYLLAPIIAVVLIYLGSAMLITAIIDFNHSTLIDAPAQIERQR